MRNGTQTRENIVRQAAALFNRQGFAGASMSDIMQATGLQKGGIYRHFESKEALALEAFDYAVARMAERFTTAVGASENAVDRLGGIVGVFERLHDDPPVPGGCPMMNTAVQTDDAESPALRDRARTAMEGLRTLIRQTVRRGIARGDVRADVDGDELATLVISTMEGGVTISRLYGDGVHVRRAGAAMRKYLDERVRA